MVATQFPTDQLAYTGYSSDYNFSRFSYERFYPGITESGILTKWRQDQTNLINQIKNYSNCSYHVPWHRPINDSHCTAIITFIGSHACPTIRKKKLVRGARMAVDADLEVPEQLHALRDLPGAVAQREPAAADRRAAEQLQQRRPGDADRRAADQRRPRRRLVGERRILGRGRPPAWAVLAALALAGCDPGPPSSSSRTSAAAEAGASRSAPKPSIPLGPHEPRKPQTFTLEQRLLDAARRGDQTTLERALELGASLGARDELQRSALILAARDAGSVQMVRFLHARGAGLDEADIQGRTALSFAAEAGRIDLVEMLLAGGAAADRADGEGRTPLFHATLTDQQAIVRLLITRGASVNTRDRFGDTPLLVACAKGHGGMAALLLEHGADPSIRDQEGRTIRERSAPGAQVCQGLGPA